MPEPAVDAPPTAAAASATDSDANGLGLALLRLSSGSRRTARAAALVAATKFTGGEVVEIAVAGRYLAHDAVVILTNRRLLIGNDRQWDAEIVSIKDLGDLKVEGWVERRAATIRLTDGATAHVIDRINDTAIAETLTTALRAR